MEYTLQVSTPIINDVGDPTCYEATYIYTYTVTAQCGLSSTCDRIFEIENQSPTFSICPIPSLFLELSLIHI